MSTANHKYSVSRTSQITSRPIADGSTIEADYHVYKVYNEYGKNVYDFYIRCLTEEDSKWLNADVGYGENKGTNGAPRFDLNQHDPSAYTIKLEGRVQRKLSATKGVCLCDVYNVYYTFNDTLVYTFYSIVEQSSDDDWVGQDIGYGSNNTANNSPDFIHTAVSGYTLEKTTTIVNRRVSANTNATRDYYVWNVHPKNSKLVVYQVFIAVASNDWFNTDVGYGTNEPPTYDDLNDVDIFTVKQTGTDVRRVMESNGTGVGFYNAFTYYYIQTGKKVFTHYVLSDAYNFAHRPTLNYGSDDLTVDGKSPKDDNRLTVKTSQSEIMRPVKSDGTGVGFYIQNDVYITRNNELATRYFTPARVYPYGLTDNGIGTNIVGSNGVPDFFHIASFDTSTFNVVKTDTVVNRQGDYSHWYRYDVYDKTSKTVIYNIYMPVFEATWKLADAGYGDNVSSATVDFSKPLVGLNEIMYNEVELKDVVKRVYAANGTGAGYYHPVYVYTQHNNEHVFTWYKEVAIFSWVGNQPSYGDAVTTEVQPFVDGNYDHTSISVTDGESVIRDMDASGHGKGVYIRHIITYTPTNDIVGSYYSLKLAMPWHLSDVGYGDNIGTESSPDFILDCPSEFNTTQEPGQIDRQMTQNGEIKPYIRFSVTLKEFPAHVCYYYYVRVAGIETWYRKDIGYGTNIGSYGAPNFNDQLDRHMFYIKDGANVYRKMSPTKGYAQYKTINVYYILDDSIVYSFYSLVNAYEWAFTDVGYGTNDLDLSHIGDLSQYTISATDEEVKRHMNSDGTGVGWYKVHTITLNADSTVLYHYYEPIRLYAFVGKAPEGKYNEEPWTSHNIVDDVSNTAYFGKLDGTSLDKTTVIKHTDSGDYFTWNLKDAKTNVVIHNFYIHVNDYPWMNTDDGYGTNL